MFSKSMAFFTAISFLVLTGKSLAAVIPFQIDFGPAGTLEYTGNESPAHALGDIALSDTTWNHMSNVDASVTTYADGSSAVGDGITVDFGAGFDNPANTTPWASSPLTFDGGVNATAPDFNETDLMRDIVYSGFGLGVRIGGLTTGQYKVYVLSAFSNDLGRRWEYKVNLNPTDGQFTDQPGTTIVIGPSSNGSGALTDWVEASSPDAGRSNYLLSTLNVTTGDKVGIIVSQLLGDSPQINGIQIVPVLIPEPSTLILVLLGAAVMFLRRCGSGLLR